MSTETRGTNARDIEAAGKDKERAIQVEQMEIGKWSQRK
jgi:hypothetical protein